MGQDTEENNLLSDKICSALQIINFLQDVHEDLGTWARVYLPQDDINKFGVSIKKISAKKKYTRMAGSHGSPNCTCTCNDASR